MKRYPFSMVTLVAVLLSLSSCDRIASFFIATPPAANLSVPELKYQVMQTFGGVGADTGIHFCDPDFFPMARLGAEQAQAIKLFPTIRADPPTFQAIVARLGLSDVTTYSDAQKLLIYREYKKLGAIKLDPVGTNYHFDLAYRDTSGQFHVVGTISPQGQITIAQKTPANAMLFECPICLVGTTRIATPNGAIQVKDLKVGMAVWTRSVSGQRQPARIIKTASVVVAPGHEVIDLRLDDGRELVASPRHPTADGRTLGELQAGDMLDGGRVVSVARVAYPDTTTYDLLPEGDTGFYWADGILIGSTLIGPDSMRLQPALAVGTGIR